MKKNNKVTVYDWPTRIFHGIFAGLFLVAFLIAKTVSDESSLFSIHMLAGLTIAFILTLRLVWGFIGTIYARFSSFSLAPAKLLAYMKGALVAKTKRYLGHNPASSYAAIIMFVCAAGLAFTGIMMAGGGEGEIYEEIHELLANLFLITVILHIAGIVFHHFKHKDSLWFSMVDGKKEKVEGKMGINSSKRFAGFLFLILTITWMGYLYSSYDSATQTLNLFGQELVLGEEEHEHSSGYEMDEATDENKDYEVML
ncbi:cytochrome b/b6 domain-containing protein [Fodinibius halophilus]|uniref:DUF4405 domain-containing protein n=1 Tax=Fodinibius halophilus TaxID=1736908 RepID=A0A6M1SXU4_9BACT|nr:cytochrome b/b6 domain-containing protein [Fodinibius halophilus]NGP88718.1 DUF4405 domain-containing protein [Fodinibius halophilus]